MAATAIATGQKTDKGISWSVHDNAYTSVASGGHATPNIIDYAESLGKATGVVTTRAFDDATPPASPRTIPAGTTWPSRRSPTR